MRAIPRSCLFLLLFLVAVPPSYGMELFGHASSQAAWWQDLIERDTKFSAYQYLRVGALDVVKEKDISIFGYGRYGYNEVADSEDPEANGRLYYLYMDWKDVWKDRVDLRLGRTWTNLVALSTIVDGAQVDFKDVGPFGVVLLGGRDITFDEFREHSHGNDTAWGGEVYLRKVKDLDLSLSYAQKYDEGDLARQTVAYDVSYNLKDISKLYSEARYDLIGEKISELVVGARVFPSDAWTIRGEYFFTYPTFDATSIYAVFAASRFHSGSLFLDYKFSERLSLYGGYTAELFEIEDASNDDAHLFEAGAHTAVEEVRLDGSVVVRRGYPGDIVGFSLAADRPFLEEKLDLVAGIDYDIYQRDEMTDDDIATKYWLGGRYHFTKKVSFALHLENTESATQDHNFAGWSSLDIAF
jgi:hypothetical protein